MLSAYKAQDVGCTAFSFFLCPILLNHMHPLAVLSHLWARFPYILGHYGRLRSRRRASSRRVEARFTYKLAELHVDFFSRPASLLEVCVLVAVDERREDVRFDDICRRCSGKQQRRRRGGRSVQLPDWAINKI